MADAAVLPHPGPLPLGEGATKPGLVSKRQRLVEGRLRFSLSQRERAGVREKTFVSSNLTVPTIFIIKDLSVNRIKVTTPSYNALTLITPVFRRSLVSEIPQTRPCGNQLRPRFMRGLQCLGSLPGALLRRITRDENLLAEVKNPPLLDDALGFDSRRFASADGSTPHSFSADFARSAVQGCHR